MKRTGSAIAAVCVASCLCLATMAFAETAAPAAPAAAAPAGTIAAAAVTASATVVKIDHKKREVRLKTEDGKEETFIVDKAVKNLDQVKKGDVVVATYVEALAYEVKKGGAAAPASATAGAATAKPGEKPMGVAATEVTVSVTITAIDEKAPSVTFKGPKGNSRTVKVKDPAKLAGVKVGDKVELTYTRAIALSVEKAPAKK
jgi:Cu/Ag efflux protein CusF